MPESSTPNVAEPTAPPEVSQPSPPPTVENPVEITPPSQEMAGGGVAPAPQPVDKKSSAWVWIIIVIVVLGLGAGGYYYYTKMRNNTSTTSTTSENESATSSGTSSTPVSALIQAYDKAVAVTAMTDKAKVVDAVLSPIFNQVFTNNVKLTDVGAMLTYQTNRQITAQDVTGVKTQLESAGYKAIDSSSQQLTMTKDSATWVISFSVGSETKATIEVTY